MYEQPETELLRLSLSEQGLRMNITTLPAHIM